MNTRSTCRSSRRSRRLANQTHVEIGSKITCTNLRSLNTEAINESCSKEEVEIKLIQAKEALKSISPNRPSNNMGTNDTKTIISWNKGRLGGELTSLSKDSDSLRMTPFTMGQDKQHANDEIGEGQKQESARDDGRDVNASRMARKAGDAEAQTRTIGNAGISTTDASLAALISSTGPPSPSALFEAKSGSSKVSAPPPFNDEFTHTKGQGMYIAMNKAQSQIRNAYRMPGVESNGEFHAPVAVFASQKCANESLSEEAENSPSASLTNSLPAIPDAPSKIAGCDERAEAPTPTAALFTSCSEHQQTVHGPVIETGAGTRWTQSTAINSLTNAFPALKNPASKPEHSVAAFHTKKPRLICLDVIDQALEVRSSQALLAPRAVSAEPNLLHNGITNDIPVETTLALRATSIDQDNSLHKMPVPLGSTAALGVGFANSREISIPLTTRATSIIAGRSLSLEPSRGTSNEPLTTSPVPRALSVQPTTLTWENVIETDPPLEPSTLPSSSSLASISSAAPVTLAPTPQDLEAHIPHLSEHIKCANCAKEPKKYLVCARCLRARYCGKYCQIWDWQLHGLVCVRSDNATDEEVEALEEWVEDYWHGALQMLEHNVVDGTETMGADEGELETIRGEDDEEDVARGGDDTDSTADYYKSSEDTFPDNRSALKKIADEHGGPQSRIEQIAAGLGAFGWGYSANDFDARLENAGEDDEGGACVDESMGSIDNASGADMSTLQGEELEGSWKLPPSSPPRMYWSRAMSLHLAQGGKFEPALFREPHYL